MYLAEILLEAATDSKLMLVLSSIIALQENLRGVRNTSSKRKSTKEKHYSDTGVESMLTRYGSYASLREVERLGFNILSVKQSVMAWHLSPLNYKILTSKVKLLCWQ